MRDDYVRRHRVFELCLLITALIVVISVESSNGIAQNRTEHLTADDPRPLAKALDMVEARCHCILTYEDPVYLTSQVVDVTAEGRKDGKLSPKVLIPRGHSFPFTYEVSRGEPGALDVVAVLPNILIVALVLRLLKSRLFLECPYREMNRQFGSE